MIKTMFAVMALSGLASGTSHASPSPLPNEQVSYYGECGPRCRERMREERYREDARRRHWRHEQWRERHSYYR